MSSSGAVDRDLRHARELWAAGAREARELDNERARAMSPAERIAEGVALVRIAGKLQAGRTPPAGVRSA